MPDDAAMLATTSVASKLSSAALGECERSDMSAFAADLSASTQGLPNKHASMSGSVHASDRISTHRIFDTSDGSNLVAKTVAYTIDKGVELIAGISKQAVLLPLLTHLSRESVLLFSKLNEIFVGFFEPENIFV